MRMMIAALAGAGTVLAAAGAMRAVLVMVAIVWVFTPARVTVGALRAVPVVAAFGAGHRVAVVAADETVAAVELRAVAASTGDVEYTAVVTDSGAAVVLRDALVPAAANLALGAADLHTGTSLTAYGALRAVSVVPAPLAFVVDAVPIAALVIFAAATSHPGVARLRFRTVFESGRTFRAHAVRAVSIAAVTVVAAAAGHWAVALASFRAVLGELYAFPNFAGLAIATVTGAAARSAIGTFRPDTATLLPFRAFRNAGANVADTGHAGAEVSRRIDAVLINAALATLDTGAAAADAIA